jgi:hypothetical protein
LAQADTLADAAIDRAARMPFRDTGQTSLCPHMANDKFSGFCPLQRLGYTAVRPCSSDSGFFSLLCDICSFLYRILSIHNIAQGVRFYKTATQFTQLIPTMS